MMRSLFSGVSGLRVHQTKMDVIANNIANVNTVGFKSSRVTFQDVFYQRVQGATGPNPETGRAGTNPFQIGLGVNVGSIDLLMSQGASQRTDNSLDLMVQGNGFFIVSDGSGVYFTRAGNVARDTEYNLHINGLKLMGWDAIKNPDTGKFEIQAGPVKPLNLSGEKQYMPPAPTTIMNVLGNLNANEDKVVTRTMEFYDTVGNKYVADVKYTYHPQEGAPGDQGEPNSTLEYSYWDFEFDTLGGLVKVYPDNDRTNPKYIALNVGEFTAAATIDPSTDPPTATGTLTKGTLVYDNFGMLIAYGPFANVAMTWDDTGITYTGINTIENSFTKNATTGALEKSGDGTLVLVNRTDPTKPPQLPILMVPVDVLDPTARFGGEGTPSYGDYISTTTVGGTNATKLYPIGAVKMDFSSFTQFAGEHTNAKMLYQDGNEPGTLADLSVGTDGKITGRYTNGKTRLLGQIPLAQFINPAGLEKVGNNLYVTSNNSGQFDGAGETGTIMGGVLEMSNVDLSSEFTEMITTQRGFQANSRIITVSDDMLQELVNLKR
jgi:flagellar hook protein FlgE